MSKKLDTKDLTAYQFTDAELDNEEWRTVPALPPHIEVSSLGRIRRYNTPTEFEIVLPRSSDEYYTFCCNGKSYSIHRLVASAFISNPDDYNIVNHINGIKTDNRVENLEWVTHAANMRKSYISDTDSRKKIYCPELDEVYRSLRSASYLIENLPSELISKAIKDGCKIRGLSFRYIDVTDPVLSDHSILYLSLDDMYQIALSAESAHDQYLKAREKAKQLVEE